MKVIALIPAFNESGTLASTVSETLTHVDHIIVVDDGSQRPIAERLPPTDRLTIIRHGINLGKGAAMKTGVLAAIRLKADVIIFLDGDGQHQPSEIPALLAPLMADQADIVFGSRSFHRNMPFMAKLGNVWLTRILQLLFRINVRDTQSGFRALSVSVWPQVRWESARYSVETEMIVNAGKHRLRWTEVPISTIYLDNYRGTTVLDGIRIFISMVGWRLR